MKANVLAYGSNMLPKQMRSRCPSARFVGAGKLHGWRLGFVGWSQGWGGAVATVEPSEPEHTVHGVVWSVTEGDLARLDAYEGVPFVYYRMRAESAVRAVELYAHHPAPAGEPSAAYLNALLTGAKETNMGKEAIKEIKSAARRAEKIVRREGRPLSANASKTVFGRWLIQHAITLTDAAKALGCTVQHVSVVIAGERMPSASLMYAIEKYTHGGAPMQAWFEEE